MNIFTRAAGGLITAVLAVILLFFLTTVGLVLALVVGLVLFVGALSMRGKRQETQVGGFRVITYGFPRQTTQPSDFPRPTKSLGEYVDLSPGDYRELNPDEAREATERQAHEDAERFSQNDEKR